MESIFERRSVRSFKSQRVEDEKVEKMLRAGMQAPSAYNQQAWEFIVVRNKEIMKRLSTSNQYAGSLADADVCIIILGNTEKMTLQLMWEQDLGACTQNVLLQATELGLGSVWYGTTPYKDRMEFIQKEFNLTENLLPYCMIGIGYPKNENANHFIDRYDADKVRYVD